jgi:hypothetical protein
VVSLATFSSRLLDREKLLVSCETAWEDRRATTRQARYRLYVDLPSRWIECFACHCRLHIQLRQDHTSLVPMIDMYVGPLGRCRNQRPRPRRLRLTSYSAQVHTQSVHSQSIGGATTTWFGSKLYQSRIWTFQGGVR